jgi:lipopolysaccharide/colanic/teichoic acid biosynthesis glycosyltransferase
LYRGTGNIIPLEIIGKIAVAKRAFDCIISAIALIFLFPILTVLAVAVRLRLGAPIFFRQTRPGLNAQPFSILKFRTMIDAHDSEGNVLPDSARLTPFGRFLRSSSLDELPELWNVLKGEMSLVGPRPLLMEYVPLYNAEQFRRHDVRPGITGWSQVNGRNAVSWDERFNDDSWYVNNQSLLLDLKILILTVRSVVRREGIESSAEMPMPKFTGSTGSCPGKDD